MQTENTKSPVCVRPGTREQAEARNADLTEQVRVLEALLPTTFYAGEPVLKRFTFLVNGWRRAITVNNELEERVRVLEAALQLKVRVPYYMGRADGLYFCGECNCLMERVVTPEWPHRPDCAWVILNPPAKGGENA